MKGNGSTPEEKIRISREADSGKSIHEAHREHKTLKDIAAAAGVSAMTVSNVLRPRKADASVPYSKETDARVRRVAREMGYVPNRAARAMRTHETGVVGFISPNLSAQDGKLANLNVSHLMVVVGLNHVLTPSGRHVVLVELDEIELTKNQELPIALREDFFDALVVHYGLSANALHLLESHKVPLIYWDSGSFAKVNCVFRNEFEVGRAVTQRLVDLGHERIGFMASRSSWLSFRTGGFIHFSFKARYEGYLAALKTNRLKKEIILGYYAEELAEQIDRHNITALVTEGSYIQSLRAAMLLRRRIPEDLSVLTCDLETRIKDRGDKPGGATYDRYQAGCIAGELLLKRLAANGADVPSVCLPFEVIDGITAAPPGDSRSGKKKKA